MAIHIQTLKTRSLTALIFVALMLFGLLWNEWSFLALFTIVHFGCWYEFVRLIKKIYPQHWLAPALLGLLYITMPILMLLDLRGLFQRPGAPSLSTIFANTIPIAIIVSIWVNDTMAYLVGSLIGKTPFSRISPKKTWEGTAGGAIICVLAVGFLFPLIAERFFDPFIPRQTYFVIAAIAAVFGTAGDLLESKLKRVADVKDSGHIMPGHGGFLDRFDSLLVTTPFVWLFVKNFA